MRCDIRDNMPQGKLSFVIFFEKCNMRCKYCNLEWLQSLPKFTLQRLEESLPYIDTICISGGEPTLTPIKLTHLLQQIKKYEKPLILYTNGYDKKRLYEFLPYFDEVYIDIKGNTNEETQYYSKTKYNLIDNYNEYDRIDKITLRCHENIITNYRNIERYILQKQI